MNRRETHHSRHPMRIRVERRRSSSRLRREDHRGQAPCGEALQGEGTQTQYRGGRGGWEAGSRCVRPRGEQGSCTVVSATGSESWYFPVEESQTGRSTMTQVKCTPNGQSLKEVVGEDADFLRTMVGEVVQQVLASEMDACLQAQKGERTPGRLGYRSGYYERPFVRGAHGSSEVAPPASTSRRTLRGQRDRWGDSRWEIQISRPAADRGESAESPKLWVFRGYGQYSTTEPKSAIEAMSLVRCHATTAPGASPDDPSAARLPSVLPDSRRNRLEWTQARKEVLHGGRRNWGATGDPAADSAWLVYSG